MEKISFADWRMDFQFKDWIWMLGLTLAYAALAFFNLGVRQTPQTEWRPNETQMVVLELANEAWVESVRYYGGICEAQRFQLYFAGEDGVYSEPLAVNYEQNTMFRWIGIDLEKPAAAKYIALAPENPDLRLFEIAFLNEAGEVCPIVNGQNQDVAGLCDEQRMVPIWPSYLTGSYFDEIYHARTAYEYLNGMPPYETTHPPLGKIIIGAGIALFGMTPFGWRFMGTLTGVLMLPAMYCLCKQLLKERWTAVLGCFLLAVDFMHFTQTRIATIDSYPVLFILLMYGFMYRYVQMNVSRAPLYRTWVPLGLSGIFMGLAVASKWIGIYGGLGLAVLFFSDLARQYFAIARTPAEGERDEREAADGEATDGEAAGQGRFFRRRALRFFWRNTWKTLGFCLVFFVCIPAVIYYLSYIPHLTHSYQGMGIRQVWDAQKHMLNYHVYLGESHPFESPWWSWPGILMPIWYYTDTGFGAGLISNIFLLGNPVVWWGGSLAVILLAGVYAGRIVRGGFNGSSVIGWILIGFASQYVPWIFVGRSTFIYHFFASVPFIILALCKAAQGVQARWRQRYPQFFPLIWVLLMCLAGVLFVLYYPAISGWPGSEAYARFFNLQRAAGQFLTSMV
jgi:hypothetical protein